MPTSEELIRRHHALDALSEAEASRISCGMDDGGRSCTTVDIIWHISTSGLPVYDLESQAPRDTNELAKMVVDLPTGQLDASLDSAPENPMSELKGSGGLKSGLHVLLG